MFKIKINDKKPYDVIIGNNIYLEEIKKITKNYSNVVFFVDSKVNIDINNDNKIILNIDENKKNMDTYNDIIIDLLKRKIPREKTLFVAIGGGVLLDVIGFVSATYKRGVDVVYVPTTLLSQVDVSIGSKNGVNVGEFKNMIGTFYNPSLSIIDTNFLKTQDLRNFNNGMAEVIKYGCIKDKTIIDDLENNNYDLENIIYKSLLCKQFFIEKDPLDHGLRQVLNFGHTYGHAIEGYYNYEKYLHGEAISIGMNIKFKNNRLKRICEKFNLPTSIEDDVLLELNKYMKNDKKIGTREDIFINIKDFGQYILGE
ncbi:MAG: 3-dehydroquinate synthase [Mycoplasmatales bacterium]